MGDDSLISDELLRTLVAVGQVDLLVGVPTFNHARTIAGVVGAVEASFRTYFPRQRTVLFNSDGGSTDDTLALVQNVSLDQSRPVSLSHGLRSTHRISAVHQGNPGGTNVVQVMLSAADLLQAGMVVILDPDVENITPQWIAALAAPIRDQGYDFVAPVYQRQPAEGLLVTQLLRPLVRATYARRLHEPQAGELGCSGRFASYCLDQPVWHAQEINAGVNLWLSGIALAQPFKVGQAPLGARRLQSAAPRPALPEVFQSVVSAAFAMIDAHSECWLSRDHIEDIPATQLPPADDAPVDATSPDASRLLDSFAQDVRNLTEILRQILTADTFAALTAAADVETDPRFPDSLWAAVVTDFLVAYHEGVMRRDHIAQALLPLYLARIGAFLLEHGSGTPEAFEVALESLCAHFEQARGRIIDRWSTPALR